MTNLLTNTGGNLTFTQYGDEGNWTVGTDGDSNPTLTTSITTTADVPYQIAFDLAANLAASVTNVTIEVTFNGQVVGTFDHTGAAYSQQTVNFIGTAGAADLVFTVTNSDATGSNIDFSGVIASYDKTVNFGNGDITLEAFAPGQSNIYQVLNGNLVKFDLDTQTYTDAENAFGKKTNGIGYSTNDDLLYGVIQTTATDENGLALTAGDVIAYDARGRVYKVADSTYSHSSGDVDANGNLWTIGGGLAVKYDLSNASTGGGVTTTEYSLPSITGDSYGAWDYAYDPVTNKFWGVGNNSNGTAGNLISFDLSQLELGNDATITETPLIGTIVDAVTKTGIPYSGYGAVMIDADGNIYVGANNGDHDLDGATSKSGAIYKVVYDNSGDALLELVATAPAVAGNDGAMDQRGGDPTISLNASDPVLLNNASVELAMAEDETVNVTAGGDTVVIDLLDNEALPEGETFTVTHINGVAVSNGVSTPITVSDFGASTYNGDGTITVTPPTTGNSLSSAITFTVAAEGGTTDTGTVTFNSSPIDGTGGDDRGMGISFVGADGNAIQGDDGLNDLVYGYAGNDKIFTGSGDDTIYGGDDKTLSAAKRAMTPLLAAMVLTFWTVEPASIRWKAAPAMISIILMTQAM